VLGEAGTVFETTGMVEATEPEDLFAEGLLEAEVVTARTSLPNLLPLTMRTSGGGTTPSLLGVEWSAYHRDTWLVTRRKYWRYLTKERHEKLCEERERERETEREGEKRERGRREREGEERGRREREKREGEERGREGEGERERNEKEPKKEKIFLFVSLFSPLSLFSSLLFSSLSLSLFLSLSLYTHALSIVEPPSSISTPVTPCAAHSSSAIPQASHSSRGS